ncbi:MAG TPA: LysR family transcriptional regulator [Gemmatimonadales bacterium]|jgi:molybdate transport repressor ModE-like protein
MPVQPLTPNLSPRIKVWLAWKGGFLMGPNYFRFLESVDETGTIREAGRAVGWSYRTCLNRIRKMESVLGGRVLITSRGGVSHGSATLTPEARYLVQLFGKWRTDMHRLSDTAFRRAARRR